MNKTERKALIRERHQARAGWLSKPSDIPLLVAVDIAEVEIRSVQETYKATKESDKE